MNKIVCLAVKISQWLQIWQLFNTKGPLIWIRDSVREIVQQNYTFWENKSWLLEQPFSQPLMQVGFNTLLCVPSKVQLCITTGPKCSFLQNMTHYRILDNKRPTLDNFLVTPNNSALTQSLPKLYLICQENISHTICAIRRYCRKSGLKNNIGIGPSQTLLLPLDGFPEVLFHTSSKENCSEPHVCVM